MCTTDNQYILVAGFWYSGSSAVVDILKEFNSIKSFDAEFTLITLPDGIIDLEERLVDNWYVWGGDSAIKDFYQLVNLLVRPRNLREYFFSEPNYKRYFSGDLIELTEKYLDELTTTILPGKWHGCKWRLSFTQKLIYKFKRFLNLKPFFPINVAHPERGGFKKITKRYLNNIFSKHVENSDKKIMLDLGSHFRRPDKILSYFDSARIIYVDRDPRDNFIELKNGPAPNLTANQFIELYTKSRNYIKNRTPQNNVLRLQFEDLVFCYEESIDKIIEFAEISPKEHSFGKSFFDPEKSKNNVAQWMNHNQKKQIKTIEFELNDFLYNNKKT